MARLTAKTRKALPTKDFAGPGRSFPVQDKSHARAALREIEHAPAGDRAKIRARADAKLGKGGKGGWGKKK